MGSTQIDLAIPGLTRPSLWKAWKNVRKLLRKASRRDVTDYFEFDVEPEQWIQRTVEDIRKGRYEPAPPYRFSLAKSMGFSRRMTMPHIRDLVVYRAITEQVLLHIGKAQAKHVHFARNTMAKNIQNTADEGYGYLSGDAFAEWMKFNQYRRRLLFDKAYPFIVLTDITNYFDTILFDRIIDAAMRSRMSRGGLGLLRFLLERLSIRDSYNESPRIGLPVDEFDCSRTLAHVVLFDHDRRMLELVGEDSYARWMDDQAFGASSRAEGLRILKGCGESLARLHLTPNASKSRILTLSEAQRHFHFGINDGLDQITQYLDGCEGDRKVARTMFALLWRGARRNERYGGEWGKVLKRAYLLAGRIGAKFLRFRARRDLLKHASLALRIGDYVAATGSAGQYLDFAESIWSTEEQIYTDVNLALAERLLRIEAEGHEAARIRRVGSEILRGRRHFVGWEACAAIAPLLILRFGDRRSLRTLRNVVSSLDKVRPAVGKAAAVVYASYGSREYQEVVDAASKLRDNYLSDFLSMLELALAYTSVPKRFLTRKEPSFDPISRGMRLDIRKLLVLRLLRLNDRTSVSLWLKDAQAWMLSRDISTFDKTLIGRLCGK